MSRAWMPLYIADYLADTSHLNNAASGSYLHLIMHYWQHGGLPTDEVQLRLIARAGCRSWDTIKIQLKPFFYEGWKHKRIEQELEKSRDVSCKRKANADKRWCNSNAIAYTNKDAKHIHRARASQSQSHKEDSFISEVKVANGKHTPIAENKVYVKSDTPQGDAWDVFIRKTKGNGQVWDKKGGWWMPSEWPPSIDAKA